nr:glycosyltransferase [Gammaproteobacteria bacterium]
RHCLQHNLALLAASAFPSQLWLSSPCELELLPADRLHYQQGDDLGQRMYHAMSSQLDQPSYDKVILIGADCLELTPSLLRKVEARLDDHELVLIPALDGGYVLIAAHDYIAPELFRDIEWSSERVLEQTLHIAMQLGISSHVMNPLRDIDHVEDLQHYPQLQQYL